MSSIKLESNASGTGIFTIASPNSNTNRTLSIPDVTTTIVGTDAAQTLTNKTLGSGLVMGASALTSGTSVTCAGQTSIDFTGIPSWVKRITVMFSGVSTNGTSGYLIQIGAGSVTTSGYASCVGNRAGETTSTAGFIVVRTPIAGDTFSGNIFICSSGSNSWVESSTLGITSGGGPSFAGGNISLGGTLDRVRITTVNGTDTFDTTPSAGKINIMYE